MGRDFSSTILRFVLYFFLYPVASTTSMAFRLVCCAFGTRKRLIRSQQAAGMLGIVAPRCVAPHAHIAPAGTHSTGIAERRMFAAEVTIDRDPGSTCILHGAARCACMVSVLTAATVTPVIIHSMRTISWSPKLYSARPFTRKPMKAADAPKARVPVTVFR
jgi:hypothetical protein